MTGGSIFFEYSNVDFVCFRWDVFGYDPEEEHPRPEYLAKLK